MSESAPEIVTRQTWEAFRQAGLLWWTNRVLHLFGWAIVVQQEADGTLSDVFPARVRYRGFDASSETEGFMNVTDYIAANIATLQIESHEAGET